MAGNACGIFTWLSSAFLFANSWFSPNVNWSYKTGRKHRGQKGEILSLLGIAFHENLLQYWDLQVEGYENNSTKASAQEGEGKKTDTTAQVEGCRAAHRRPLALQRWRRLCMCTCSSWRVWHLLFSAKRGFIQLNCDHKIGLGGLHIRISQPRRQESAHSFCMAWLSSSSVAKLSLYAKKKKWVLLHFLNVNCNFKLVSLFLLSPIDRNHMAWASTLKT